MTPFRPSHAGEILRHHFMGPLGLSAYRVAKEAGITPIALSQILRGTRGLSAATALKLGAYFGTGPLFWWKVQALCDLLETEAGGAGEVIECCPAMAGLVALIEELGGPTGCWRSVTWRVTLKKPDHAKTGVPGASSAKKRPGESTRKIGFRARTEKEPSVRPQAAPGKNKRQTESGSGREEAGTSARAGKTGAPVKESGGRNSPSGR